MKKFKNIISIVSLLCCTALTFIVIYAWYVNVNNVNQMKFNILQIDSLITLYQANDSNFNGVPDKLISNDIGYYYKTNEETPIKIEYASNYYSEVYSFNYVDQRYALSEDSESNLLNTVVINDILPSKVYCFKYEIINYALIDNSLEFTFDSEFDPNDIEKLNNFDCRLGIVNSSSNEGLGQITFGEWTDFVVDSNYSGISLKVNSEGIVVPAQTNTYENLGRLDLWLQIRVKADCTMAFSSFRFPENRITLSIERESEA